MNINFINYPTAFMKPSIKSDLTATQSYFNLKPLTKDTVSFSGSRKFHGSNMSEAPKEGLCREIEANAEPAKYYLNKVLKRYLTPSIELMQKDNKEKVSPLKFSTRIKSHTSIREKVVTKYLTDGDKSVNPKTIRGIKYYANDIVGARITLKDYDPKYIKAIILALKNAADDGNLKINSIENFIPDSDKLPEGREISDYEYASYLNLQLLAKATGAQFSNVKSKSGYCAIHINVDLSDPVFNKFDRLYNGYCGEIQIIGDNVEKLKDTEDLCYKIKDNKIINSAYAPFKNYFLKYYNDDTKDAFNEYTYALFISQMALPPGSAGNFPSIKQLGFEGKVPPELDFNILRKLKRSCDMQIEVMKNEEKLNKNNSLSQQETINSLKQKGDINTLKKYIDYIFK